MAPTYRKLAKRFRPVDSVVIAKMDGTANEHENVTVEGYPSLFLFPAGKGAEPVPYEDPDRSLKVQVISQPTLH
jgi:protein disulfide-isomerase A1